MERGIKVRQTPQETSVRGNTLVIGCIFIGRGLFVLQPLTSSQASHIQSHKKNDGQTQHL